MSTKIPLTYHVEYEVGIAADSLTPARIREISAQQFIFFCQCLFYLLRQSAISAPHDPLFKPAVFLHVLEDISLLGEAVSHTAYDHVEHLFRLTQPATEQAKR
jgi:hypothetical protein